MDNNNNNNNCKHEKFMAQCNVTRLTETEGREVNGYTADLTIICAECKTPFEFTGVPNGYSHSSPMASIDFKELRIPIRPNTDAFGTNSSFEFKRPEVTNNKEIN